MDLEKPSNEAFFAGYSERLQRALAQASWHGVSQLADALLECWRQRRQVFLCGNGGSAGNAVHLANDIGYDQIFAEQLAVHGAAGDVLIVLSGSGNSPNILRALERARALGVKSYAVLGYSGGKCKALADVAIHFPVEDMQIAEDLQLVVGHMLMQFLYANRPQD